MTLVSGDIDEAKRILESENIVAIPTETVYGLAGNIFSETAIRKIFELKKRPLFNPLIVHISSPKVLSSIARKVPEKAQLLANTFWPDSLTLVLPKRPEIPDLVTAGKDTVAVRMPNHPITLKLLENLDFPLAAPSANPFGNISPTESAHVANYFENELAMVLEGGKCKKGIESTIVGFENDEAIIYRLGALSVEDIEAVIGPVVIRNKKEIQPNAPGMLARHYAPRTRTYLVEDVKEFVSNHPNKKVGVLAFQEAIEANNILQLEILSNHGNLEEAAANLYSSLHRLDDMNLDMIVAERLPDNGLGKSINDRLTRATKTE